MSAERILSLRFLPLAAVAALNYWPETGGDMNGEDALDFDYDETARTVVYQVGAGDNVQTATLATLPDGYDAHQLNTGEPSQVNICDWYVGTKKDVAELRKAEAAYRQAKHRLLHLLGNSDAE